MALFGSTARGVASCRRATTDDDDDEVMVREQPPIEPIEPGEAHLGEATPGGTPGGPPGGTVLLEGEAHLGEARAAEDGGVSGGGGGGASTSLHEMHDAFLPGEMGR